MKPEHIDQERYEGWIEKAKGVRGTSMSPPNSPPMIDLFCAGEYLSEELRKLGGSDEEVSDMCFAMGQRSWPRAETSWKVAETIIAEYKDGIKVQPGPELGEKIATEWLAGER